MKGLGTVLFILLVAIVTCAWWSASVFLWEVDQGFQPLWLIAVLLTVGWIVSIVLTIGVLVQSGDDNNILIIKMLLASVGTAVYTSVWWMAAVFDWVIPGKDTEPAWLAAGFMTLFICIFAFDWIYKHWNDK